MKVLLTFLFFLLMTVAPALGQSAPDGAVQEARPTSSAESVSQTGYLQAALLAIIQPAGVAHHRVSPPISGRTPGMAVAAGVRLTPELSIEGEFVFGRTLSRPQRFSYLWLEDYTGETRDLLLNGNLRWRPRAMRRLELHGGAGLAVSRFAKRSIVRTDLSSVSSRVPDLVMTSRQPTLGGGIATPFPVGPSIEIAPLVRVSWVRRAANGPGELSGTGSFVYHLGTTVRVKM